MALFDWGPKYCIGIKSVDDQHKRLVDMLNQLHEGMMSGKGNSTMGPVLQNLVDYTIQHFKYEETIFGTTGYEDAAAHKADHDKLVAQVAEFNNKFKAGSVTLSNELMNFLKTWLIGHIMGTDRKYVSFLQSKGIT